MSRPAGVHEGRVEVHVPTGETVDVRRRARGTAWKVLALVVGVLLLALLLGTGASGLEPSHARHTSFGTRPGDHLALIRTLEVLDYPVVRHQRSYGQLPLPATDHLLVTLDPLTADELSQDAAARLDKAQVRALREWLESGGHWVATWRGDRVLNVFGQRIDVEQLFRNGSAAVDRDTDPLLLMRPTPEVTRIPAHGVLAGEASLQSTRQPVFATARHARVHPSELAIPQRERDRVEEALRDLLPTEDRAPSTPTRAPDGSAIPVDTPTLRVFDSPLPEDWEVVLRFAGQPLAVRRQLGAGQLTLVSTALPFSNAGLGLLDLGPAAVALLHDSAESGRRRILVDEFCHGYLDARGALWWARERGLFDPLLMFLALLAFVAWRSAVALAPARTPDRGHRRAVEEFVIALADISRRAGRRARATRSLIDARELLARERGDGETAKALRALRDQVDAAHDDPRKLRELAERATRCTAAHASAPPTHSVPPSQETPP